MSQSNSRVNATELGLKRLKDAKDSQRTKEGKRFTYELIAELSYVSVSRVKAFFRGERIYRDNAIAIAKVLGLELREIIGEDETTNPPQKIVIEYQTCQRMLEERKRLSINPLTSKDGKTFNYSDIYVPLGLVEKREQEKQNGDVPPEQGSSLYSPRQQKNNLPLFPLLQKGVGRGGKGLGERPNNTCEITQKYDNEEFFTEVLEKGNSPKSQGQRIAIIGEPGAGKTTQLQKIADWVLEKTDQEIVIWVSLADLQGRTLEDYLFNVWLKDALKTARVTEAMEDGLVELFNESKVWLLLDGVDEMGVNNPLYEINSQIKGWIASARVVLTCRVNVWDAGKNHLEKFDIYRNLDFSDSQRDEFINKWFFQSSDLGESLKNELMKSGKERIKDLVKNPLRLSLLCYAWQKRKGDLPETKAGLYQWFVDTFYQWKEEYFSTTSAQRKELNKALGTLAKEAIDQPVSRFRLTRRQVVQVLGELDEPLCKLAIDIGWLNQVGVAEENPDEPVYAFFHPTFQEYFAAVSIEDGKFFLNHISENPDQGIYRIFEPQWKEVILLWFGKNDLEQKNYLMELLENFDDNCEEVYNWQALLWVEKLLDEFPSYHLSNEEDEEEIRKDINIFKKLFSSYISQDKNLKNITKKDGEGIDLTLKPEDIKLIYDVGFERRLLEKSKHYLIDVFEIKMAFYSLNQSLDKNRDIEDELIDEQAIFKLFELTSGKRWNFDKYHIIILFHYLIANPEDDYTVFPIIRCANKGNNYAIERLILLLNGELNLEKYIEEKELLQDIYEEAAEVLKDLLIPENLKQTVSSLKASINDEVLENERDRYLSCYNVLWYCAQNLNYPEFYKAWHF
ncbi:NACHT domain-containing protein [Gloeothece citriformis]|nr:NACHT domain-containing protein [Gloeothece citriformis]